MFNNLINVHDLSKFAEKIRQRQFDWIRSKLTFGKRKRIKQTWERVEEPPTNWWNVAGIGEHWNHLISGDPQVDYHEYITRKYFADRRSLLALSLACGSGERELRWTELGKFERIDAYDLSEARIECARSRAEEKGLGKIINYLVADVYDLEIRENYYDVILAEQALHHFSPLEEILLRANRSLKESGYFIANEFVGPTRFQWTDRQLEVVNGILSILPAKYKTRWDNGSVKSRVFRPGRLSMVLVDPSEAVESSKILPLLYRIFNVIEVKGYGGTILQTLFSSIAHNFHSEDPETKNFIKLCFNIEDLLLGSGDIQSDFVVAVCQKR